MPECRVVDIHIHMVGTGDSMVGCRMSNEFLLSRTFVAMLSALDTTAVDVRDDDIRERILGAINGSVNIDCAVLLALDGVYKNGAYVRRESHLVVPNDYIIDIAGKNGSVLFGASVHPYRAGKDMQTEMKKCLDNGAVLFHWVPSCQQIDPEDKRCIPFYETLAEKGVPLLCSIGDDAVSGLPALSGGRCPGPRVLEKALGMGVKVIVSLCAVAPSGKTGNVAGAHFDELLDMLAVSEEKGWGLYADVSAFCPRTKKSCLEKISAKISGGGISPKRFIYGSDFPMLPSKAEGGNALDDRYKVFKGAGLPDSIFSNACEVLGL